MGRVEAGLEALEKAMAQGFQDIKDELKAIKSDVEELKQAEHKRKGALGALMLFAGFMGGLIAKFGGIIFGGH